MRPFAALIFLALFLIRAEGATESLGSKVIRIDGAITAHTLFEVSRKLSGWQNKDPIPGGLIVLLNSPGGDGEAAMQIGRLLRQKHAQVFVTGQCESSCVFIMAGGVVRAARPGSVGVHAGRLALADPNGRILKELDANRSLEGSFKLTQFNSVIRHYFAEMGIEHGLLDVVLTHQTRQTYRLSEQELRRYRLVGFDENYLQQRAQLFESQLGEGHLSRNALYERTLSVPSLCLPYKANSLVFISCYKKVIFSKAGM